jgi:hypothetical protein
MRNCSILFGACWSDEKAVTVETLRYKEEYLYFPTASIKHVKSSEKLATRSGPFRPAFTYLMPSPRRAFAQKQQNMGFFEPS